MSGGTAQRVQDHPLLVHPLAKTGIAVTEGNSGSSGGRRRAKGQVVQKGKALGGRRGALMNGTGTAKFESGREQGVPEDPLKEGCKEDDAERVDEEGFQEKGLGANEDAKGQNNIAVEQEKEVKVDVERDGKGGYIITRKDFGEVRRVVGDFLYVHSRLREVYPGLIVPELPALALGGRLTHGYAHEKRVLRGLQEFVRAIVRHKTIGEGRLVRAFITGDGWEAERKAGLAARDESGLMEWMGFLGWQVLRGVNEGVVGWLERGKRDSNVEDKRQDRQEELSRYIESLLTTLKELRETVGKVEESRDIIERRMEETRNAVDGLQKVEEDFKEEFLGGTQAYTRAWVVHSWTRKGQAKTTRTTQKFIETLEGFEERAAGARRVLERRGKEKAWYEYAVEGYVKKRDEWERQGDPSAGGNDRLRKAVADAAAEVAKRRDSYALIAKDFDAEMRRFRGELHHEIDRGLCNIASDMREWHAGLETAWAGLEAAITSASSVREENASSTRTADAL